MIRMLAHAAAVAVAAAVATLAAGAPADAICQGCATNVGYGTADMANVATGQYAHHVLTATCTHKASFAPPDEWGNSGSNGLLAVAVSGNVPHDASAPYVEASCRLTVAGPTTYPVNAAGQTQAARSSTVPQAPDPTVVRLCLSAKATWWMSAGPDVATLEWCSPYGSGVGAAGNELVRLELGG